MPKTLLPIAFTGVALLAAACATASAGTTTQTAPVTKITLPLDPYLELGNPVPQVQRAQTTLAQACMRQFGLGWPAPPGSPPPPRPAHERRYGQIDPAAAARYGYHLTPNAYDVWVAAHRKNRPKLSRDQLAVWAGQGIRTFAGKRVPQGGCAMQTERVLQAGAPQVDTALANRLNVESHQQSEQHPRVKATFADWSRCMKRAGFNYATPWDANDDPRWRGPKPNQAEIATAVADVKCKQQARVVVTWLAEETTIQQQAINKNSAELSKVKLLQQAQARNATRTN